jgi:hypothetical protein
MATSRGPIGARFDLKLSIQKINFKNIDDNLNLFHSTSFSLNYAIK